MKMKKFILVFLCALFVSRLGAQQPVIEKTADFKFGIEDDEVDWRDKFLYLNMCIVWIPKVYTASSSSYNIVSVGVELLADVHPISFLSVRVGAELSQDLIVVHSSEIMSDMILDFPVSVAYVFSPKPNIMLEPYLGVNLNFSLQGVTSPYHFSWNAGAELSLKTALGTLMVDPGFSRDFGKSSLKTYPNGEELEYWRSTIHLGIGFKIGIMNRFY